MGHFAKVRDGFVVEVIVAEPEFFDSFVDQSPGAWIQTSYNTHGGIHASGGKPLRMNFAGVGYAYDIERDVFIPPQPADDWVLNEATCLWNPPAEQTK